jgi:hypothetical protein
VSSYSLQFIHRLTAFSSTGVLWIVGSLLIPETYPPVLLRKRAAKMSEMTGKIYRSKGDVDQGPTTFAKVFKTSLLRPWILLFREPIVLLLSIYMAIIYGTLYMLFAAFPIVYQQGRGWSQGIGGLAFLGVAVGMLMAVAYSVWDNKRYVKISGEHGGFAPPEARLPPCILGGICLPVGLFWFAWTNSPSVHWMASIAAGVPFGFGMVLVFLGQCNLPNLLLVIYILTVRLAIMNFLIDSYTIFAASVLAANSVLRSLFGAAFPLFTGQMYDALGIHWASTIPAFLALVCVPMPFLFYKYGPQIRERCKYAKQSMDFMRNMQKQMAEGESKQDEQNEEQEAFDYSYEEESHGDAETPKFEEIKTGNDRQGLGGGARLSRTSTYEHSPYDIDRVNTRESFTKPRSRASSLRRGA